MNAQPIMQVVNLNSMHAEPVTMGYHEMYCDPKCPYLDQNDDRMAWGTCKRDGEGLGFYDWFLAHCKD